MSNEGVIVNCLKARLLKRPSDYSDVIKWIDMLTNVIIENREKDFYKVKIDEGVEGYIHKNYIALKDYY